MTNPESKTYSYLIFSELIISIILGGVPILIIYFTESIASMLQYLYGTNNNNNIPLMYYYICLMVLYFCMWWAKSFLLIRKDSTKYVFHFLLNVVQETGLGLQAIYRAMTGSLLISIVILMYNSSTNTELMKIFYLAPFIILFLVVSTIIEAFKMKLKA